MSIENRKVALYCPTCGNDQFATIDEIDNSAQLILIDREKMPYEILEPQKSFELKISTYGASPSKVCIVTEWEDEEGNKQTKKQLCDL